MFVEVTAPGVVEIQDCLLPGALPADSARVAISYAGLCHSDRARVAEGTGPFPYRLGHEASGIVTESTSPGILPGTRVTAYVADAYATEVVTAAVNVVPVADGCSLEDAALAEPLACTIGGFEMLDLRGADEVAVVGAGFMGLLMVRLLAAAGHRAWVVEPREGRRATAIELGAHKALHPDEVTDRDSGRFRTVVEAVGSGPGLDVASDLVAVGGTLGVLGYHQSGGGIRRVPMESWNFKGIEVLSLHHRDRSKVLRWIERAQRMSALGVVNPAMLVDSVISLEEIPKALSANDNTVKVLARL